ncbi:MAG: hypothetical protein IJX41_02145 [Bacteroidaceae bacterium]|nr:hypothetical protein [Bacteroidaceae bacterium]
MKACTNEKCGAYGKAVLPDNAKFCPMCGHSMAKYGYHYVLDFLKKANISYTEKEDRYNFNITDDTFSFGFELIKRESDIVLLAISAGMECEDGSLSEERLWEVCNEVNIECPFAKLRYISNEAVLVSSCTFYMDANTPLELLGEMIKDTHEAMSLFVRKMS